MKASHRRNPAASRHPAFTLVELLVTVTIIIVIAALSFSGFSRMRKSGDRAAAMRNLSQLQLANIAYSTEFNGQFVPIYAFPDPPVGSSYVAWMNNPQYLAYLKGDEASYKSDGRADTTLPISLMDPIAVRAKKNRYTTLEASYGFNTNQVPNGGWAVPGAKPCFRSNQLTSPERSAAFITGTDWNISYENRFLWQGAAAVEGKTTNQKLAYRHNGKALVVYYDGHVGEVTQADMRRIDGLGGANNIFWKANAP